MLNEVSVVGAAGKMGRGISLVLLRVMAMKNLSGDACRLHLVDSNNKALASLKTYFRKHLYSYAEENINVVRQAAASIPELVSNEEIVSAFVEKGMDVIWSLGDDLDAVKRSEMIFEAVDEDLEIKTSFFSKLNAICKPNSIVFTNTSSIPIHLMREKSGLKASLVGFHFYDPPHLQSLVEVVFPDDLDLQIKERVYMLIDILKKVAVFPKDVPGFIGSGHLVKEVNFACHLVQELAGCRPFHQALFMVDTMTREFLKRPMGIFQFIDSIGCGRFLNIASTMEAVPELLSKMKSKPLFEYKGDCPITIFDAKNHSYHPLTEGGWVAECHTELGEAPDKQDSENYLKALFKESSFGALLAQNYLGEVQKISELMVEDQVAKTVEDIDLVMTRGYHHPFGPSLEPRGKRV